ncbi:hypothetical protein CEXT_594071 [Caerostris extrusa]|uniref:LAGLIDADG homing endonuclease n=1 Tax=Caerostris extrusa TaxID=172846 RepID=A0AAV4T109_CAEEX|nr:hypothetical protein CEXT_594071 [Caerostris extrusa]
MDGSNCLSSDLTTWAILGDSKEIDLTASDDGYSGIMPLDLYLACIFHGVLDGHTSRKLMPNLVFHLSSASSLLKHFNVENLCRLKKKGSCTKNTQECISFR